MGSRLAFKTQRAKAGYMGSETWPEHHNIGPKEGTEGLKINSEWPKKGYKEFETGFIGLNTGSDEHQTSFKVL